MNDIDIIRNKLLAATIANTLNKESEKGSICFSDSNSVISTCDCYFSSNDLINALNAPFTTKNGICYSINYQGSQIVFRLVLNQNHLNNDELFYALLNKYQIKPSSTKVFLYEKPICSFDKDEEDVSGTISGFINKEFLEFNDDLAKWISNFKQLSSSNDLHEGSPITVELTKYERNREARLLCIRHFGAKCMICGFDFEKAYGKDFAGMIEVHHKIPLSEIKEDYVVDPINDLIPVCPNCHSAIHSKPNSFYTVEEMLEIVKNK